MPNPKDGIRSDGRAPGEPMTFWRSRRSANARTAMKPSSRIRPVPTAATTKAALCKTSQPDAAFFRQGPIRELAVTLAR